jgi:hypothetical protein
MCNGSKTIMTTLPFTLKHNTPTKAPNKQNRKKIQNIKLNNQTSKNVKEVLWGCFSTINVN